MAELGSFAIRFKKRQAELTGKVLAKLMSNIQEDTPVLTGALRASWRLRSSDGRFMSPGQPAKESDASYTISTHLPYGIRIEYEGWSQKAPNGMVRINLVKVGRIIAELKTT